MHVKTRKRSVEIYIRQAQRAIDGAPDEPLSGNDIISLVGTPPRYELRKSNGPDLRLADLLDADALGALSLGYGIAAGDPALRAAIAAAHGVDPNDVVVTAGGRGVFDALA